MAILDPRPVGWFAVALSHELKVGQSIKGVLCTQAYQLERLDDQSLRFSGSISAIVEKNGFIHAWHHPFQEEPSWQIPELDNSDWRPLMFKKLQARSHPQETFENSIDIAHFPVVHGFTDISVIQAPNFDEHTMNVRYQITRKHPIPFLKRNIRPQFEVRTHGLGCAHNHIEIADFGMNVRMFVFSTPTDVGCVDIRLGVTIHKGFSFFPLSLLAPLVHQGIAKNVVDDFCQDIDIWQSKEYKAPPILVKGDGPISRFRQWCKKYYVAEPYGLTHK